MSTSAAASDSAPHGPVCTDGGRFCLPDCPQAADGSRLPSAAAALEAGLRPCPHCRPERVCRPAGAAPDPERARLHAALDEQGAACGSVTAFAAVAGIGVGRLRRLCRDAFGASPSAVLRWQRLALARRLLDDSDAPAARIAPLAGFADGAAMQRALARVWPEDARALRRARRARRAERAGPLTLYLPAVAPFAGPALEDFFRRRALPGIEVDAAPDEERRNATPDGYRRHWRTHDGSGSVHLRAIASGVLVRLCGVGTLPLVELTQRAERMFDLDAPMPGIVRALRRDPLLAPGLRAMPGRRVPGCWDPFELAVRAVLGQQVSVAAARTHAIRLVALCDPGDGTRDRPPEFPDAERLAGADLTTLAMPGSRKRALTALAEAAVTGALDFAAPGTEVRAALLALPGIGPWTADYVAMRGLGDRDAFPAGDLVVRQALARGGALPSLRDTAERAGAWRPFRAYAVMHLWDSVAGSAGG